MTLVGIGIITVSAGLYLVLGDAAGVFVGKLLFPVSALAVVGLIPLVDSRRGEPTDGISCPTTDGQRRVLVIANEPLEQSAFRAAVHDSQSDEPVEAMIVIPVRPSSRLRALTDDIDRELSAANGRLDSALAALCAAGITATGRVDVGSPARCLLDGLREFSVNEVALLCGRARGWQHAEQLAGRLNTELGLKVVISAPADAAPA